MKTIVLGDIHGGRKWKEVVNKENPDRVIFLGDYFDNYEETTAEDQMNNFMDIIELKKTSGKEVIILIGNHDYHYLEPDFPYTGFQEGAGVAIGWLLKDNLHHMQICYFMDNVLFTHAGVTNEFLRQTGWGDESIPHFLIDLFHFKRRAFQFISGYDKYGDNIFQSPIWVRPRSLVANSKFGLTQVVGHTKQPQIMQVKNKKDMYYFIDTLGISGQYLIIENGKITKSYAEHDAN